MKAFLISFLLLTTNAFAVNVCDYDDWSLLLQGFHKNNIHPVKHADVKNLSHKEIKLIHQTVVQTEWSGHYTEQEALEEFLEMWDGEIGELAGEISYYRMNGNNMISVIYYPGDNVYGAYWFEKNGKYELIAHVDDSSVVCK